MNSNIILEARNLGKSYHDGKKELVIFNGLNLRVHHGESLAIVGASGSGKSTLLHLLGGLDTSSSGDVLFRGKNLAALSEKEKGKIRNEAIGFVYQFHHLLRELTALENAMMPLLIRRLKKKEAQEKAEAILTKVGLKDRMHHYPAMLSGGERQRVAIARALVTNPICMLADEPTGDLDPKTAREVFDLFFGLSEELGTAFILATHDHNAAQRAKTILALSQGQLLWCEEKTPEARSQWLKAL
jgi:lipoprotein-releasing system ATP-binding protein